MSTASPIEEIEQNRRTVAFDTYDLAVRQIVDMVGDQSIEIAPAYQRHFVWDSVKQSQLIESLFLGIPIPSLFMATNRDATWEVVDGLQRINSIINFVAGSNDGESISKYFKKLTITGLEKLPSLNGKKFESLPKTLQNMFLTRPIKVTVLNDRSDLKVRYDLFERLNTGGISLHPQEIRNCIFLGPFSDFIQECAEYDSFKSVVKLSAEKQKTGTLEELVLKFFAYMYDRNSFVHGVKDFLNDYMEEKAESFTSRDQEKFKAIFQETFDLLDKVLDNGIVRSNRPNVTPLVLFEAVSIGVAECIRSNRSVDRKKLIKVLDDETLKQLTTGATNSRKKLAERIDFVKQYVSR